MSDQTGDAVTLVVRAGITFALAFGIGHAVTGCSSSKDPAPAPADAGASSSGDAGPAVGECAAEEQGEKCFDCCAKANGAASDKFTTLVITCLCPDTTCKEACKDTYCGTTNPEYAPGSPCDLCITEKDPVCSKPTNDDCSKDPACKPVLDCFLDSACSP